MLLLVGLGNPGAKYAGNRHNIGFMAVDAIVGRRAFDAERTRFHGRVREGRLGTKKALILKPATFMNESGRAVGEALRFYKLDPRDIVVFHDELDLAPGKLRMKSGGGHAGHNGLRSLHAHIGEGYRRVRLGIGHPGDKDRVTGHVLGDFAKADADWLDPLLDAVAVAAPLLADGEDSRFQSDVARMMQDSTANGSDRRGSQQREPRAPHAKPTEPRVEGPFAALRKLAGG